MHSGNLATSQRLKATLAALQPAGSWHSTRDIAEKTFSMAVHSDLAALKDNQIPIAHRRRGKIHEYCLLREEQAELAL